MTKMENGPACVRPSVYVGIPLAADDRMRGIAGTTRLVGNGMTTAVKQSDNSDPKLTPKLNAENAAARRSGTTYMQGGDR
jgi:hypothetical protein